MASDGVELAVVTFEARPCLERHPTLDEPCVRTDAHSRHRAETSFNSDTYHATNCWTWVTERSVP